MLFTVIIIFAKCLEQASCTGFRIGSKFAQCNHPTPNVLSDHSRQHDRSGMMPSKASIQIVIIVAMYIVCINRAEKWGDIESPSPFTC